MVFCCVGLGAACCTRRVATQRSGEYDAPWDPVWYEKRPCVRSCVELLGTCNPPCYLRPSLIGGKKSFSPDFQNIVKTLNIVESSYFHEQFLGDLVRNGLFWFGSVVRVEDDIHKQHAAPFPSLSLNLSCEQAFVLMAVVHLCYCRAWPPYVVKNVSLGEEKVQVFSWGRFVAQVVVIVTWDSWANSNSSWCLTGQRAVQDNRCWL